MSDVVTRSEEIKKLLKSNVCEVTFTKINGEVRIMKCTLQESMLPSKEILENTKARVSKPDTISAYDLNKGEWRSMKTLNVTNVEILNANK